MGDVGIFSLSQHTCLNSTREEGYFKPRCIQWPHPALRGQSLDTPIISLCGVSSPVPTLACSPLPSSLITSKSYSHPNLFGLVLCSCHLQLKAVHSLAQNTLPMIIFVLLGHSTYRIFGWPSESIHQLPCSMIW